MPGGPSVADLRAGFADPPPDSRPMMRWWWFGPAVERDEIDRELQAMRAAGIGGVEVAYVYPLSADSPDLLSDQFLDHLRYAAERCRDLGLRFDLTLGSGWSFGGPHISTELAASMLHWDRREIPPHAFSVSTRAGFPGDQLIAAYVGGGTSHEPPVDCTELPVDGDVVEVPAGTGPRQLLLAYARPTGQVVKRAAAGADGPVLDHYSAAAARAHLDHFAEPLLQAVPPELIGSVFCDSLEVYGANWTPEMITEFERRRGYQLTPRLYELIIETAGSHQLRADFHRTLTELYEENFAQVFHRWSAEHGVKFRIQGYGTPPATVSSYRFADLYEGEGWGWKEITQTRWATSAAHLFDQPVVSSETWTWVHSPSFRATPLDLKGEAHEHLLVGVNHLIGHGWPYSPSGAAKDPDGLGWYFYAAGALDDRNPWWPAMPYLMRYLQRLCWLMRQGNPVADVLIYVPSEDVYPRLGHELGGSLDLWKETRRYVDPAIPATIREGGWDFDLVDDHALAGIDPIRTPIVLLPDITRMPAATRDHLQRFRTAGGKIISVDHDLDLHAALSAAVAPDLAVSPNTGDIGSVHRRLPDADLHLVVNTGPERRTCSVTPRETRPHFATLSTDDGRSVEAGAAAGPIEMVLEPYQAIVLLLTEDPCGADHAPQRGSGPAVSLDRGWTVGFGDQPPRPVALPHRWEDEPELAAYSGTARYRTTVDLDDSLTGSVLLDFGPVQPYDAGETEGEGLRGNSYRVRAATPVGEVVQVMINGQHCGTLWAPPYAIEVGDRLQCGQNEIELLISNTAAAALAHDTALQRMVQTSRSHYGQRFVMQDLDLALDGVSSGLMSIPVLRSSS
jgi:hypothetical protein